MKIASRSKKRTSKHPDGVSGQKKLKGGPNYQERERGDISPIRSLRKGEQS